MHLKSTTKAYSNTLKQETFRIVLDEPRLYIRESLGSAMVRGEVIVNFSKDTYIRGPIELIFEGIQRFHPWQEIMIGSALGSPIETKLQVIELSLLPPNSQGFMPAGIQRFPFEFPIPASLPTSVDINDRMEIFYQIHATLRRANNSASNNVQSAQDGKNINSLINWARHTTQKSVYTATSPIRIVRAMESIITDSSFSNAQQVTPPLITDIRSTRSSIDTTSSASSTIPWNRRNLDNYQGNLDDQHDSIAFSLAGRSLGNLAQPIQCLCPYEGIRYKIGIDRTAIALGTSIGVEVMVQPTFQDVTVKSILLKVTESRKYSMNVPAGHVWGQNVPVTRKTVEQKKMVLKWAYDYSVKDQVKSNNQYPLNADPLQPGYLDSKLVSECLKQLEADHFVNNDNFLSNESEFSMSDLQERKLVNLKELDQHVSLGEYFRGRFVMPVPDCSNILHPSMEYDTISIKHWIQLIVTVECNGKIAELNLETPGQVLDCRLVNDDDGHQTLIPPPPAYQPGNNDETNWKPSTFWEQREPITLATGWGTCVPCPCEARKLKALNKTETKIKSGLKVGDIPSPTQLPEWGPPPSYTMN